MPMLSKFASWLGRASPVREPVDGETHARPGSAARATPPHGSSGLIATAGTDQIAEPWARAYSDAATEADIFHCFRLLLGRHPHREEWTGHAGRVGHPLGAVVAGYLGSLEFERRRLLGHRRPRGLCIAEVEGFRIYVAPDDTDVGSHVAAGRYEPEVTAVFRRHLRPGMSVLDVGANIGYFSMLSASLVGAQGHVLAVEPNPRNARMIEASRRLNDYPQVTVAQVAAGQATGLLALHAAQSNGTTSTPSSDVDALLEAETVPSIRLDDLVASRRRLDLIKLDVEGAEYNALLGCQEMLARDRPVIVSEFSPALMPGISGVSGVEYLRWIMALRYEIGCIRPDGTVSAPSREPEAVMAEYASRGRDHLDFVAVPA